ncbi:hypothetical protein PIROE2DRAFT_10034 [Piromyces sp. E2]|nr:hypothetical protein PIROE2DRAFT_10034 [Piromyces sp. E2]|eukprot:OUM63431.1 hypothetical protein PIROE2DRAFT_10034 [Piromyces sp. E2]
MSISDFEQSLWELALLINPTHLANITTSKLNSYYQDTILDMRKVVLVQNLFNDIYNNWTDHQIRYQQNRRRQIENGEITEQQLLEEESEENESEIEYISDEEGQESMAEEGYEPEYAKQDVEMEDNKENIDANNANIIVANDNTIIQLPVRKDSVAHKSNGKPIKKVIESPSVIDTQPEPAAVEPVAATKKSKEVEKSKTEVKANSKNSSSKEMKKKSSKAEIKEQKAAEAKENVKQITLDFSGKDAAKTEETVKSNETPVASEEKETQKKSKKEHSRRKKIEREPRKDSLKANVNLSDEKSNEIIKELQKSGVIHVDKTSEETAPQKNFNKSDSAVSLDEKTDTSINSVSSSNTSGSSFVIRSFNIPSQNKTETSNTSSTILNTNKPLPTKQDPIPIRKSSTEMPAFKKNKATYRLSDKEVSIKNKYKLDKSNDTKDSKKTTSEQPKVHLRPKKITPNDPGMPPAMQRRSMDDLLFQFADVMDIVSLIPHIVGDDDLLGNDLTFNSSDLNSKVQTKDSNGNVIEEAPRRRPSRAPTPPPTVVSNGKEYEVYSIPSERHQKYIKKKEEMEKSNKRRSSLKFEYHEFEELRKQQELAGYDTTGDVPVTERKKEVTQPTRSSSKSSATYKRANTSSTSNNSYSNAGSCGAMKMDVLSTCMTSNNSNSSHNSHSSSNKSSSKRSSRFFNLTKSKSKSKDKEKEKEKEKSNSSNKENISSNANPNKSYLVRRKSGDKSSSSNVRSYRYKLGGSPESSSSQPSPTLSSISSSSTGSKSSSAKKSYSSTTLSKYDLPHMSSLSSESSSRHYRGSGSERERSSSSKQALPTVKSSPGLFEGINLSSSSSTPSSSSSKHRPKKATDHKSSSTSEIDKFFDNVFRIDWSL